MSPRNQVLQLSFLCLRIVSNQLIHALSDDEGKNYKVVEKYLVYTTYEVLQDLLKNILNSVNLDAATRFSCLQVLLREDVKKLDTGIFPHSYYEQILETICVKGKRLQQLNLKGVWARDHPQLLSKLIRNLKYLKVLVIPHMADDSVLEAIRECDDLSILDICGEACYTVHGIERLESNKIRVLDIGNFGKMDLVDKEHSNFQLVARIIEQLPNLTILKTYSFTGHALLLLYEKNEHFKTKLKYLHDTETTMEIIEAIINLCPYLDNMHIDSPCGGVVPEFSKLNKLHSLKLTKAKNGDELRQYLSVSGAQLHTLKLNHSKNHFALDLSELCVYVPDLHTLECFQMRLTFTELDNYFMALQNVELSYCDMSDHVLRFIMAHSPFLKRIIVGSAIQMTDGDFFRLCAECDFACLEEIWFSCARGLTSIAVELLMGHCPNLKTLGQLSGWDVPQDDLDYLRTVIASSNIDLTLLPVGSVV